MEPFGGPSFHWKDGFIRLTPLTPPDALNPVCAHVDAVVIQNRRYPPIAIAAVLSGKEHNVAGQLIFIGLARWNVSLCSSWLADDPSGGALAQLILFLNGIDCPPALQMRRLRLHRIPWSILYGPNGLMLRRILVTETALRRACAIS